MSYHDLMADASLRFSLATYNGPDSVENQAGASLDAAWTGTPTYGDNPWGGAAFDVASGRYLEVVDGSLPSSWTCFCRVYARTLPTAGSNGSAPFYWGVSGTGSNVMSNGVYYTNAGSAAHVFDSGTRQVLMDAVPATTWTSLCATGANSGTLRGYINGVQDADSVAIGTQYSSGTRWLIGRVGTNTGKTNVAVDGLISELLQFSRVLDASEVAELHAGPEPTYTSGAITLNADLTYSDNLVWESYSNGSVTETTTLEHYVADQWEEDPAGFTEPVDGRDYRVRISAANDGGNDPDEDQVSNTITYTAPTTANRRITLPITQQLTATL